jgi:aminomethyltransferase
MAKSSPFEALHLQLGATMKEYDGWRLPSGYGSTEAECLALRSHCAAFDLSGFGRVSVKGPDAAGVLAKMGFSNLPPRASQTWNWVKTGSQRYRIAALQSEYVVYSIPGADLASQLRDLAEKGRLDVQIADLSEKTALLGLYGPQAFTSMSQLLPFDIDEMEPGAAMPMSFFMINFTLLRGSWLDGEGLELMGPVSTAGLIGGAITKYHKKYNITPAGMECLLSAMEGVDK